MLKKLWPAIFWAIIIFILISLPGNFIPKVHSPWSLLTVDKLVHTGIFFILTFLLIRGFYLQYSSSFLRSNHILAGLVFGIVFGGLTEAWQAIINIGRFAHIYDFIANTIGCIIAWPAFLVFKNKLN